MGQSEGPDTQAGFETCVILASASSLLASVCPAVKWAALLRERARMSLPMGRGVGGLCSVAQGGCGLGGLQTRHTPHGRDPLNPLGICPSVPRSRYLETKRFEHGLGESFPKAEINVLTKRLLQLSRFSDCRVGCLAFNPYQKSCRKQLSLCQWRRQLAKCSALESKKTGAKVMGGGQGARRGCWDCGTPAQPGEEGSPHSVSF